ncbi:MAG TPA: FAD-dependent monooxygenase, partial [Mycobacterium sp.]
VDVAVYEKAHEIRELGAGVVIGENGARVYDTLGLRDALAAIAGKINGWSMHTWTGEPLTGWRAPYPPENTYPLHRAEFQRMLFDALPPGTVRLGHGCTTAVEDADGVRIEFSDGSSARADVLVGADGIHSVVQTLVGTKSEPVSEGIMAYRGLIPAARLDGVHDMKSIIMSVGPGQSFLTFPVSSGTLLNVVAFVPTDLDVEESWSAPGDVAALAASYDGWNEQVRRVIKAMDHTFRWGIYDRAPLTNWSTDRITLLGDAAHAVTPHLGQGANQSVEDAITLAVLLEDVAAVDVPARLRLYEELRIERNRQVREGARAAGAAYRSTDLAPGPQAERIVAIYDPLELDTYDAERVAQAALARK